MVFFLYNIVQYPAKARKALRSSQAFVRSVQVVKDMNARLPFRDVFILLLNKHTFFFCRASSSSSSSSDD